MDNVPIVDQCKVTQEISPGCTIDVYIIDSPEQCHKYPGHMCYCPGNEMCYHSINGAAIQYNVLRVNKNDNPVESPENIDAVGKQSVKKYAEFYVPPELEFNTYDCSRMTDRIFYAPLERNYRKESLMTIWKKYVPSRPDDLSDEDHQIPDRMFYVPPERNDIEERLMTHREKYMPSRPDDLSDEHQIPNRINYIPYPSTTDASGKRRSFVINCDDTF